MSCIVHAKDKKGRIYAFESTSYWDKEKKAPRSKRTYLGRVDENGNIVPKKVAPTSDGTKDSAVVRSTTVSADEFAMLMSKLNQIETQLSNLDRMTDMLSSLSGRIDAFCSYGKEKT